MCESRKVSPEVTIRPWTLEDAEFLVKVRNTQDIQRWFRQDRDLTVDEQRQFMKTTKTYHGFIVEAAGKPVGFTALVEHSNGLEFSIGILPEHQKQGIASVAMTQLLEHGFKKMGAKLIFSDVFVKNPALTFYIRKCGFRPVRVKERAYYKKHEGLVDVVEIEREAD